MRASPVPIVDWRFLAEVNLWQVALVIIALWILGRLLVRFWPGLKKTIALVESLGALPTFMAETKKTLAEQSTTLESQNKTLAAVKHEVLPNSGDSLRDAVDQQGERLVEVVSELTEVNGKLAADKKRLDGLQQELEHTQPHPPKENEA